MTQVIENDTKTDAKLLCSLMLRVRRLNKMLNTYYIRMKDRIYPDSCVRLSFHHCSTITGRLSGDFQQVPNKNKAKVKQMFISRYRE